MPNSQVRFFLYVQSCLFIWGVSSANVRAIGDETMDIKGAKVQLDLLRRADVLEEIAATPKQKEQFRLCLQQSKKRHQLARNRSQLSSAQQEQLRGEMWVEQAGLQRIVLERKQLERLNELRWRYQSLGEFALTVGNVVDLTDDQKSLLAAKESELGNELREMMLTFHRRALSQLQQSLTLQEQADWSAKTGDEFEFESSSAGLSLLRSLR